MQTQEFEDGNWGSRSTLTEEQQILLVRQLLYILTGLGQPLLFLKIVQGSPRITATLGLSHLKLLEEFSVLPHIHVTGKSFPNVKALYDEVHKCVI